MILRVTRGGQRIVGSPDIYGESEVLIEGMVQGAEVLLP